MPNLSLVILPFPEVPPPEDIEKLQLGEKLAKEVVQGLAHENTVITEAEEVNTDILTFSGDSYFEAIDCMEKYLLQHCSSDGFPVVPPTEQAVNRMLEGTDLPREHIIGRLEPSGASATVEKIAINAVMAGCIPTYMSVLVAAVDAITDTRFELGGVQRSGTLVSPLMIISGPKLIQELNVNYDYSSFGPGWRSNSTIGRALRLIMMNIGQAWPGKNDLKSIGSPFKFVTLIGENEEAYKGLWEPIRVAEGFDYNQPTISIMPAVSWQPDHVPPEKASVKKLIEVVSRQGRVKYDRFVGNSGMEDLLLLSPTAFDILYREKCSRKDLQNALYEAIRLPCREFFDRELPPDIPQWLIDRCKNPDNLAPILSSPQSLKIIVTGGAGPSMCVYISTWGWRPAHFVTQPIKLPQAWQDLLSKYKGWETPFRP